MDNKRLDEAVEAGLAAYYEGGADDLGGLIENVILAGMKVLMGEAVGFVARDNLDELHAGRCSAVMFGTYSDRHGRTIPLYAPSLGEGE